ncbi:MAG: phosphoribosylformylglycinamidine synthase subunit PurQ [Deltaproteobacteria bacterium]|nr:MAG: phosphoribosylformylglycinamidine synthase subunit PurQ [Deltaproteobacteria bacterium]
MRGVRVLVLAGNGINCEYETAYAFRLAGAEEVEIVFIYDLLAGEKRMDDYHILCFPGGFLDGDDLGAAKACANRFRYAKVKGTGERLWDQLMRFIEEGKLILGICNGFQLLVKMGLVPAPRGRYGEQVVTLTFNDSGRFEDRWVYLRVNGDSPCVFTRGLQRLYLPVRHGEGKFITGGKEIREEIEEGGLICLQYTSPEGEVTMDYPYNPNGSEGAIAGVCDPTGRIFGLMPHPEAYLHYTHHPRWTREELPEEGEGVKIFRNGVKYVRENLL